MAKCARWEGSHEPELTPDNQCLMVRSVFKSEVGAGCNVASKLTMFQLQDGKARWMRPLFSLAPIATYDDSLHESNVRHLQADAEH